MAKAKVFRLAFLFEGAYAPEIPGVLDERVALAAGRLNWNLALHQSFALIGQHRVRYVRWENVGLLTIENEAGLRWKPIEPLSIEALYLGHRAEQEWVDDLSIALGGVRDHGGELGSWYRFKLAETLRLDTHIFIRYFRVYKKHQAAFAGGLRLDWDLTDTQSLEIDIHLLAALREDPRPGMNRWTLNPVFNLRWALALGSHWGLLVGLDFSTHLLVGQVPMLELRRSLIKVPFGGLSVGLFWQI